MAPDDSPPPGTWAPPGLSTREGRWVGRGPELLFSTNYSSVAQNRVNKWRMHALCVRACTLIAGRCLRQAACAASAMTVRLGDKAAWSGRQTPCRHIHYSARLVLPWRNEPHSTADARWRTQVAVSSTKNILLDRTTLASDASAVASCASAVDSRGARSLATATCCTSASRSASAACTPRSACEQCRRFYRCLCGKRRGRQHCSLAWRRLQLCATSCRTWPCAARVLAASQMLFNAERRTGRNMHGAHLLCLPRCCRGRLSLQLALLQRGGLLLRGQGALLQGGQLAPRRLPAEHTCVWLPCAC